MCCIGNSHKPCVRDGPDHPFRDLRRENVRKFAANDLRRDLDVRA